MLAVIIPAYNRSNLLTEALDSLVAQTHKRFITVIVDDNSEENLQEVVDKYSHRLHTAYLKQPANFGPGAARNRGLQWCFEHNIELVMFLDSDDLLMPKAIERLSKEINVTNKDIIVSQIQGETKQKFPIVVHDSETVWTHGKIYRISFLKQNNILFPEFRTNEDLGFNTVAFYCALAKDRVLFLDEQLYLWRHSQGSITRKKSEEEKKQLAIQLSKDFLRAIYFSYKKFLELNLDIEKIGPKIAGGLYTYVSILKHFDSFEQEDKAILKEIFSNESVQLYIKRQEQAGERGIFANIKQIIFYLNTKIVPKQNICDFIYEYSGIKI